MKSSIMYRLFCTVIVVNIFMTSLGAAEAQNMAIEGTIEYFRAHDLGGGYGPSHDFVDGEFVIKLTNSEKHFIFQLRQDEFLPARYAMVEMLMEAFRNDWQVRIEYRNVPERNNHELFRVWLIKDRL